MLALIGLAEPSQSRVRQTTALPEPLHEHSGERLAGFVDHMIQTGTRTVTQRYKIIPGIIHMRHI